MGDIARRQLGKLQLGAASVFTVVMAIYSADESARNAAFMQSHVILAVTTAILVLLGALHALHLSRANIMAELWCGCMLCLPIPNTISWLGISTPEELRELESVYLSAYQGRPLTLFIGVLCLGLIHRSFVPRTGLRRMTAVAFMMVTTMINPVHVYWLTNNPAGFLTAAISCAGFGLSTIACELALPAAHPPQSRKPPRQRPPPSPPTSPAGEAAQGGSGELSRASHGDVEMPMLPPRYFVNIQERPGHELQFDPDDVENELEALLDMAEKGDLSELQDMFEAAEKDEQEARASIQEACASI